MPLDNFFIEKAKNELRETEARKSQSLEQFRDWIAKHPFLSTVRQDDHHLLQYLRAKKYNMNDATVAFERFYLAKKKFSKFIPQELPTFEYIQDILRIGFCYPLNGRDHEGCRVVFIQSRRLNTDLFSVLDGIKLTIFVLSVVIEDEESQICGIKLLMDHQDITSKHIMMPKDIIEFVELFKTVNPARQKASIVVNLPTIAHVIMEMLKSLLTEKLRKRLLFFQNWDELKESDTFDVKMLPKELGGVKSEAEILDDFEEELKRKWDIFAEMAAKSELDWSKVPDDKKKFMKSDELVGSFRKLDID